MCRYIPNYIGSIPRNQTGLGASVAAGATHQSAARRESEGVARIGFLPKHWRLDWERSESLEWFGSQGGTFLRYQDSCTPPHWIFREVGGALDSCLWWVSTSRFSGPLSIELPLGGQIRPFVLEA